MGNALDDCCPSPLFLQKGENYRPLHSPIMLDVLIFGLGARVVLSFRLNNILIVLSIGSTYGYILHAGGQVRLSVVARSNASIIRQKGLSVRSVKFGDHDGIKFNAVYSTCEEAAESGRTFSYVICTTKALLDSIPPMEDMLRPVISRQTVIVLIQNGVGQEVPLHTAFPATTIISCVCWTGAQTLDVGVVEVFTRDNLILGVDWDPRVNLSRTQQQQALDILADIFIESNAQITVQSNIQVDCWVKLIWNSAWNSLTALTQLRTSDFIVTSSSAQSVARHIFSEGIEVARAKGIAIPDDTFDTLMAQYTSITGFKSSMLTDALKMQPMEVEAILGTPLKEGTRLGMPVPTITVVYSLLKALEWKRSNGYQRSPSLE
ncbi:ketopantoate reductase PanE/ApbA C terminal-domain-containing protein [Mycena rebaudengoi]|nr:ketopantoate reductase PanE/ApbA C terminal-domain-containing protein [Mycena rebaudengoi]